MKILHYALGFPPYRSGGLTKMCIDLMVQQAKEGLAGWGISKNWFLSENGVIQF